MSVAINRVLKPYGFFDTKVSDKHYDQYSQFLKRSDWRYLINFIVTYHSKIPNMLIQVSFNERIEAFLIFNNYGLIKNYHKFNIVNAITQEYTLDHPEIYQFLLDNGHKMSFETFSLINLLQKSITNNINVDAICGIVTDMFLSTEMRNVEKQEYIRTLSRLNLTPALNCLRSRNYDIHKYVENIAYPTIDTNIVYQRKLDKYIYHSAKIKSDPDFFELVRYFLFKYSLESVRINAEDSDEILLEMYKYGLTSNLDVATLLGEYGYVSNSDLSADLLKNPQFYDDPMIYQRLIRFGDEFSGFDIAFLINNKNFNNKPITKLLKDFIHFIIKRELELDDDDDYDDDTRKYMLSAAKKELQLLKYMIIDNVPYADVKRFCQKQVTKTTHPSYYLDILDFIDDYENTNLPVLYPYYDTVTQDFIKNTFMSMYLQTELPYELMMKIIIQAM